MEINQDEKKVNKRITQLLIISLALLAFQLTFFWGLPPTIVERVFYILAGICFGINIFLLASQYTPGIITDFAGIQFNSSLRTRIVTAIVAIWFLFWGILSFIAYLIFRYI